MNEDAFFEAVEGFINLDIPGNVNKNRMLALLRTRIDKLSDINDKMSFFITLPDYATELFLNKKNKITEFDTVRTVLNEALLLLDGVESFDNDTLFATLSTLNEKLSLKTGTIMWCIRIAVSGMAATPGGATEIMEVIGKEESLSRIKTALAKLG